MGHPTANIPSAVSSKLEEMAARHAELTQQLADPAVLADHRAIRDLSIKRSALDPVVTRYQQLIDLTNETHELREALTGDDPDLVQLAREELPQIEARIETLSADLLATLVTADDSAIGSVILEVRAGVGGDEAGLWAAEILDMYRKRAALIGWRFELMDAAESSSGAGGGGIKSASATISGQGVWTELAHEAGVHCVKRVPATEAQGRVHTSTATVAVLPEPEDVDITVDTADVEEHITTSQGPGGQNVNKVATAVHLIHKPTGIEVRMQETKSQRQNREKAWRLLRARLYENKLAQQRAERAKERSEQIGAAGRSERIRTYRFKDSIAVDHRLGESFNLQSILSGEHETLAGGLHRLEVERRLAEM